jgi:AcrR family transcriptional regulator
MPQPTKSSGRATPLRSSDKAIATRAALVELAAELFSTRGYLQTSIRDVAREASVTTGAIYGHFRNKAELLAAAIADRTERDLDSAYRSTAGSDRHVDSLRTLTRRYPERRQLRALILQGSAAALTDDVTRQQLRDEHLRHLRAWVAAYAANRDSLAIDPSLDLYDAVLYSWAAEVGLGVLEALGIEPKTKKGWADAAARFARSFALPQEPPKERS